MVEFTGGEFALLQVMVADKLKEAERFLADELATGDEEWIGRARESVSSYKVLSEKLFQQARARMLYA